MKYNLKPKTMATQAEIFTDLLDEFITKKIEYSESINETLNHKQ